MFETFEKPSGIIHGKKASSSSSEAKDLPCMRSLLQRKNGLK